MNRRLKMKLLLEEQKVERRWSWRSICEEDIPALGRLMLESYRDTIDYRRLRKTGTHPLFIDGDVSLFFG